MKKYLKSLRLGLTISTALVLVGNQVAYAEETNTATTQASPAATSESTTTTAPKQLKLSILDVDVYKRQR